MPAESKAPGREVSVYILTAFGIVLAIGLIVLTLVARGIASGSFYRTADGKITLPTSRLGSAENLALAAFEAPPYQEQAGQSEIFTKAMEFYQRKMYLRALPLLGVTSGRQPDFLEARFYLGVCFLLTDRLPLGIKELRKVTLSAGENPYREPAHFYLAKGLIARNAVLEARDELQTAVELHGPHEKDARELLSKLSQMPAP